LIPSESRRFFIMKWGAYYRQSPKTVTYRIGHRRKAAIGYYTQEQWQTLCSFFDGKCARCHKEIERFSPDHIRPASRGGTNYINNIQPLCWPCNKAKSNIYTFDYRPEHVKEWAEAELKKMLSNTVL